MLEWISKFLSEQFQSPLDFAKGILVVLALAVTIYLITRFRRANKPIIPFRAEGGDVEIAPQTIRGLINNSARSVSGVENAHCSYQQKGSKLNVVIKIHLLASSRLVEVEREIKQRVRQSLHLHVGMEPDNVKPIKVRVAKIVGEVQPLPSPSNYEPTESGVEEMEGFDQDTPESERKI